MKGFVKPILIVVGFFWVIGVVGAGFYLVQKRQTVESQADASFCPQQGYLPLNVGEVCPAGTEETTISPLASGSDPNATPIRCCKSLITADSRTTTDTQTQSGGSDSVTSSTSDSGTTSENISTTTSDGDSTQTQTSTSGDTAQIQTTDNSCPVLPQLKVNVTCLNCIDSAQ